MATQFTVPQRLHIAVDADTFSPGTPNYNGGQQLGCNCAGSCAHTCSSPMPFTPNMGISDDYMMGTGLMEPSNRASGINYAGIVKSPASDSAAMDQSLTYDLPFLHPSDPTTYSTLPPTLNDSNYDIPSPMVDYNGFYTTTSPQLGSIDWTGFGNPSTPAMQLSAYSNTGSTSANLTPQPSTPSTLLTPQPDFVATPQSIGVCSHSPASPAQPLPSAAAQQGQGQCAGKPARAYAKGTMTLDMSQTLLNRLQWYQVTCKLRDNEGRPILQNQRVTLAEEVAFVDGRRRQDNEVHNETAETGILVSAAVTCASTGKRLDKCKKCIEKDKSLRKRKRKRDEDVLWSEQDEENNNKLVQLYSTGAEEINDEGDLKIKLRIGCCVGVTKQHHLNHIAVDPESCQEALEIHRSCDGVLLSVTVFLDHKLLPDTKTAPGGPFQVIGTLHTPIRILGKVTEAERQKQHTKDDEDEHLSGDEAISIPAVEAANGNIIDTSNPASIFIESTRYSQFPPNTTPSTETSSLSSPQDTYSTNGSTSNDTQDGEQIVKRPALAAINDGLHSQEHVLPSNPSTTGYASQVPGTRWNNQGHPTTDIEEMGMAAGSRRTFKGCSSCAARGDRELFTAVTPVKLRPSIIINHFKTKYRSVFEKVFAAPVLQDMTKDTARFFAEPPFESFSTTSPAMLQVYTVLAVGACISGYMDSAEKFWNHAIRLAQTLIASPINGAKDTTLLADGLNRISYYFGSGGDAAMGAYFNNQAIKSLQVLSAHSDHVFSLPVYETALWSCVTYHLDRQTIDQAYAWAIGQNNFDMRCHTLFLKIMTTCLPDLKNFVSTTCRLDSLEQLPGAGLSQLHPYTEFMPVMMGGSDLQNEQLEAYNALVTLRQLYQGSGHTPTSRQYDTLAESGFLAIEAWFKGDRAAASSHAKMAAIQSSLLDIPQFAALIPTYFACFICCFEAEDASLQLNPATAASGASPFADYTELCVKAFTRVSHYRWIRVLVDYFVQRLYLALGRRLELHTCPMRGEDNFDHTMV